MHDLKTAPAGDPQAPADTAEQRQYLPREESRKRLRRWRRAKDQASRSIIGVGGISVIVALGFMFAYLFYEVMPMLWPASVDRVASYEVPGTEQGGETLHVSIDRYREVGFAIKDDGTATFFRPESGEILEQHDLPLDGESVITAFGHGEPRTRLSVFGLSNGRAVVTKDSYSLDFPESGRVVVPKLGYPLGEEPVDVDPQGAPIAQLGVQQGSGDGIAIGGVTEDGRLVLAKYEAETDFLTGDKVFEPTFAELEAPDAEVSRILISTDMRDMIVGDRDGNVHYYNIANANNPRLVETRQVVSDGVEVSRMDYLLGTVSIVVGGSDGSVRQFFLVRGDDNERSLTYVRSFDAHPTSITSVNPEFSRKGFATGDENGNIGIHYATSNRSVVREKVSDEPVERVVIAPRHDGLMTLDAAGMLHYYDLWNKHPEVSLAALWDKVWYEGREEPTFTWQSSSATQEFEPKFSLTPLTLGTIKAAFYAMLFATPLAVCGAVYSAYFMTSRMRGAVKPTIEIMEALPTVILGFIAGLWFAPFVEAHLPAMFTILVGLPLSFVLAAYLWTQVVPRGLRNLVPNGWEAALLMPVIVAVVWGSVAVSPMIEVWLFNGDMRQWLTNNGYTFDQRNSIVVGVAMGFAVIPTIFSIAEDAIFNVPRHLTQGSLALGATTWQTVTRVVLLTASPGIFSAVMIGMGRAVGETMIVLMATGNTPIMNFNIFEGMRTLSANIAVEMPETAVGSTHFRILFLGALVLFIMTFALNTVAEIVRQRLRKKYSSL